MSVQVNWMFESDTFGEDIKGIVEEVKRQGHNAVMVDKVPAREGETFVDLFKPDDCVLFYGSLGFSEQIKKETKWVPGSIHNSRNFEWMKYHRHFKDYLLGRNYYPILYRHAIDSKGFLYDNFGVEDTIFIRPNSGNKPFAGQLMELKYYDLDMPRIGYGELDPNEPVIVSRPVDIETEWRLIVADHKVIAGSQYLPFKMRMLQEKTNSSWDEQRWEDDNAALAFANGVLDSVAWEPDRLWSLDVCKTSNGNYYVIEINSFSCSGFYKCNRQEIVTHASRIALDEWGKKHG